MYYPEPGLVLSDQGRQALLELANLLAERLFELFNALVVLFSKLYAYTLLQATMVAEWSYHFCIPWYE